ncbi:hypothetical protein [Aestuariibacter salexigens]|uniref:hypothetical protein n=1 Tax=Aestuariibacter salexigens TaxID=226010 RepID=UPI00047B9F07|nr:hypothetical protein [Aestuariibacter salexigens]
MKYKFIVALLGIFVAIPSVNANPPQRGNAKKSEFKMFRNASSSPCGARVCMRGPNGGWQRSNVEYPLSMSKRQNKSDYLVFDANTSAVPHCFRVVFFTSKRDYDAHTLDNFDRWKAPTQEVWPLTACRTRGSAQCPPTDRSPFVENGKRKYVEDFSKYQWMIDPSGWSAPAEGQEKSYWFRIEGVNQPTGGRGDCPSKARPDFVSEDPRVRVRHDI